VLPGPDGSVRFEAVVPPGTATLHVGITSIGDHAVRVGPVTLERAAP
jgi:hypothetical protein